MKTIGFDVDGVLAAFSRGFSTVANQLFNTEVIEEENIQHWNWEKDAWSGMTKGMVAECWNHIRTGKAGAFWQGLDALASEMELWRIGELCTDNTVYFITTRPDTMTYLSPQQQTRNWLAKRGIEGNVIIASNKGKICEALGIQAYIDDKFINCVDVFKNSKKTWVYMLHKRHNSQFMESCPNYFEEKAHGADITVVHSVIEYLDSIGDRYGL